MMPLWFVMITLTLVAPALVSTLMPDLALAIGFGVCFEYWLCHWTSSGGRQCEARLTLRCPRVMARHGFAWCRSAWHPARRGVPYGCAS